MFCTWTSAIFCSISVALAWASFWNACSGAGNFPFALFRRGHHGQRRLLRGRHGARRRVVRFRRYVDECVRSVRSRGASVHVLVRGNRAVFRSFSKSMLSIVAVNVIYTLLVPNISIGRPPGWCHRRHPISDAAASCGEPSHPAPGPHRCGRAVGGGRRCKSSSGAAFSESNRWECGVLCGMSRFLQDITPAVARVALGKRGRDASGCFMSASAPRVCSARCAIAAF